MPGQGRDADVVVVGAGPAGAAAAITLARAGRDVVVVDKARFPRDKTCGDGLTTTALHLLEELGLDPGAVPSWQRVDDVVLRSPSGRVVTLPFPRGQGTYAAVARRHDLDAALVDLARDAGAKVLDGQGCTGVAEHRDGVDVDVADAGTLHAGWVVAADGVWSPVRKHLGLATPGYRGEFHAFRQYFSGVGPRAATDLYVWFEPDMLPGYVWSFPLPGNRANVGFGIVREGGKVSRVQEMAAIWRELLDRPHIRSVLGEGAEAEAPHRAWPIPARVHDMTPTGQRTLFVGDAVAATDPMTGEGIAQALLTGQLAARAIVAHERAPQVTQAYRRSVRRALHADHRLGRFLGRALAHSKSTRGAVRFSGLTPWVRRNFARWLFEDYPRAVLLTPRRWRPRMFAGGGAFRD